MGFWIPLFESNDITVSDLFAPFFNLFYSYLAISLAISLGTPISCEGRFSMDLVIAIIWLRQ